MKEFSTQFSLTHKPLQIGQPYLRSLLSFTPNHSTSSSSLITLNRPSNCSRLKITDRSFYHSAPALWNTLPPDLRQLFHHHHSSQPICNSPVSALSIVFFSKKSSRLIFFIFRFLHSLYSPRFPLD